MGIHSRNPTPARKSTKLGHQTFSGSHGYAITATAFRAVPSRSPPVLPVIALPMFRVVPVHPELTSHHTAQGHSALPSPSSTCWESPRIGAHATETLELTTVCIMEFKMPKLVGFCGLRSSMCRRFPKVLARKFLNCGSNIKPAPGLLTITALCETSSIRQPVRPICPLPCPERFPPSSLVGKDH